MSNYEESIDLCAIPPEILSKIEEFADRYLPKEIPEVREGKIIHDAVHGTFLFSKFEVALLNTPLIQRLRQIRQTAFTYLTYPSATHSRFEHTIGVVSLADKLTSAINRVQPEYFKDTISLRTAAIMHDCGHGPFSHTSEEIYKFCTDIENITDAGAVFENTRNPHEALSSLIVLSKPFKDFLDKLQKKYGPDCDCMEIANTIVGKTRKVHLFNTEVLNGPFDADKLDYIYRDGHFSGLPLMVDYDRLWYSTKVNSVGEWRRLTVAFNGVTPVEQILFGKMVLFSTIYHHHKVRACDCMLKGIFELIMEHPDEIKIDGRSIINGVDFLWLTDEKIFALASNNEIKKQELRDTLHKLIHNLQYRRLLKRAIVISSQTIENKDNYMELLSFSDQKKVAYKELRNLAIEIWEQAGKPCYKEEIWIDLPKVPRISERELVYVHHSNEKFDQINKFFPIDTWTKQYALYKWRGHVFCPAECISQIAPIAKDILEKKFNLKFNKLSFQFCHLPEVLTGQCFK